MVIPSHHDGERCVGLESHSPWSAARNRVHPCGPIGLKTRGSSLKKTMPRSAYGTDLASVTETRAPVDLPIPLSSPN